MNDSAQIQQVGKVDDLNSAFSQFSGIALVDTDHREFEVMEKHLCKLQTVDLTSPKELVDVEERYFADRQSSFPLINTPVWDEYAANLINLGGLLCD